MGPAAAQRRSLHRGSHISAESNRDGKGFHEIEAKLKEGDNPRLTVWMLMMRRHEKDFMLRRDTKYVGELKKAAAEFSKLLAEAEMAAPWKAEIAQKLEKYQTDFSAWATGAQEVASYGAAMSKTFH